ncbi:MAG: hypothetical protein MI807_17880, partial [Verrucomicrobiales bacterium]|nr:hypothetical protein [Verrucomicrobiales bacterium]
MPFFTEEIDQTRLETVDDVSDWVSDTQNSLTRIPVRGALRNGAYFQDDQYLGDGDLNLHFNERGFQAFCQRLG